MKIIKVTAFVLQFSLIGLAMAIVYLVWQSDHSGGEIIDFVSKPAQPVQSHAPGQIVTQSPTASYADAVASSFESVVTIYTSKTVLERSHPLLDDPVFNQLFGEQLKRHPRSKTETSLGSGVIVGNEGYIITNQHVIDGADEILIALPDGRGSQAALIGEDKETDIAILQIPISGLSSIKLAAGQPLRVGDIVLAIGNPLNVGQTVTMGIISATGRNRVGLNTFENFIQTDAAINPGNSGGALVNTNGQLIGINTAIFSRTGGAQGIGFAIPISIALDIMQQLIDHGKVIRGWLGVEGTELTAKAAMSTGNPNIKGALIVEVYIDSPADRVGIRTGDILVGIDGKSVSGIHDLLEKVSFHKPGDTVELTVYRGPEKFTFQTSVAERPN